MADRAGLHPRAWYFTVLSLTIVASRPIAGRLADQAGPARVLLPSIVIASGGYALLALPPSMLVFSVSAILVGLGFGSMYPVFAAWVLHHVGTAARGAAFGGILAALDTGIGSGSIVTGWVANRFGFRPAFAVAAVLAIAAAPYLALVGQRVLTHRASSARQ
jgi:MFS family permease